MNIDIHLRTLHTIFHHLVVSFSVSFGSVDPCVVHTVLCPIPLVICFAGQIITQNINLFLTGPIKKFLIQKKNADTSTHKMVNLESVIIIVSDMG